MWEGGCPQRPSVNQQMDSHNCFCLELSKGILRVWLIYFIHLFIRLAQLIPTAENLSHLQIGLYLILRLSCQQRLEVKGAGEVPSHGEAYCCFVQVNSAEKWESLWFICDSMPLWLSCVMQEECRFQTNPLFPVFDSQHVTLHASECW